MKKDNYTKVEDIMSKSEFSMVLSDFLHSSEGAKFKTDFEFDGELVCGEPAPPIRVSKFSVGFYQFYGPSEHIPAKHALETLVNSSGKCFSSVSWKPINIRLIRTGYQPY